MRRHELQKALEKAGLDEAAANKLANESGGNLTILRRRFARDPLTQNPDWKDDIILASLLLAGSWDDGRPADREAIEQLTGQPYEACRAVLTRWSDVQNAPVRLTRSDRGDGAPAWEFLSPIDAWEFLHIHISPELIARFKKLAVDILSEENPSLSLSPDDRPMAQMRGKVWKYSGAIRHGVTEILAVAATRADESGVGASLAFSDHASSVLRAVVPDGCGWQRWASLGGLLPALVEAAPEAFLAAVERDIRSPAPQLQELMRQEVPAAVWGACYHSGILWALETAAWPTERIAQVALILGRFTELDPGGTWGNRPLGSTARIFFSWRPQTVAAIGERKAALRLVCERFPAAGWEVVKALMPQSTETMSDSAKPSYRDWADGWTGTVTRSEYRQMMTALAEWVVHFARQDATRWTEILRSVLQMHFCCTEAYELLKAGMAATVAAPMSDQVRTALWEKLRRRIGDHTYHQDADWALPPVETTFFAELRDKLAPTDPISASVYLFSEDGFMGGDKTLTYDERRDRRLMERRRAIRELWGLDGFGAIQKLLAQTGKAWSVGHALGEELREAAHREFIPAGLDSEDVPMRQASRAFALTRIRDNGTEWAESVPTATTWNPAQLAAWALQMDFSSRTWQWLESRSADAARAYWEEVGTWGGVEIPWTDAQHAVTRFQATGRGWAALDFLMSRQDMKHDVDTETVCSALEFVIEHPNEARGGRIDVHHVRDAIAFLQEKGANADDDRLAKIESAFLPILDRHSLLPKTLHRRLARIPQFFVECIQTLFKARHHVGKETIAEGDQTDELADAQPGKQELAKKLWQLLHDWRSMPGSDEDGQVDAQALRAWVVEVRTACRELDRLEVCDITLGGLFAKSCADSDGATPLVAIRDVIEECQSEDIEQGLSTGFFNLRGGFSKGVYEGGAQERKLAERYARYAVLCSRWPRTAAVHRQMAKNYHAEAAREDERAQARD